METCSQRSTSSVWGSAWSHVHPFNRRVSNSTENGRGSRVSLEINSKSGPKAQICGSRDVVCKTPAEYKANKLNRNEQTKLDSITVRVVKEQEIAQRKFKQSERMLRAKSATLAKRIQTLKSSSFTSEKSDATDNRPKSEPILRRFPSSEVHDTDEKHECLMCEKIQQVIKMYETEGRRSGTIAEMEDHSTCLFSDLQMRSFLTMLETNYFSESPALKDKLRESGIISPKGGARNGTKIFRQNGINNSRAKRNVEMRIKDFCRDLEHYKKTHSGIGIPKEIQEHVERIRLKNAAASSQRQTFSKQEQMRKEVEEILRL